MGRPTKITQALIEKAKEYNYKQVGDVIPTIEGFALFLGINRDTIYAWRNAPAKLKYPTSLSPSEVKKRDEQYEKKCLLHHQFSDIVNDILHEQARLLINNGLKGKFNANITKLILSGKHGYVEKQQTDLTTNGKDLPTPILGGIATSQEINETV